MKLLGVLAGQRVDALRVALGAQGRATRACVSPRVNRAEPWARGSTPLRISMARTVRVSRPSMRGSPARIWRARSWLRCRTAALSTLTLSKATLFGGLQRGLRRGRGGAQGLRAGLLAADLVGRGFDLGLRPARRPWRSGLRPWRARPLAVQSTARLAGVTHQFVDGVDGACLASWPNTTAPSMISSDSWSASDSTISTAASVPATTRSSFEPRRAVLPGFSTYSPLT